MLAVKFFVRLDPGQICLFLDGHLSEIIFFDIPKFVFENIMQNRALDRQQRICDSLMLKRY